MIAVLTLPLLAGLAGVLLPAFGYFPSLGGASFTSEYLFAVAEKPGFWHSLHLSLWIGLATTFLSLVLVAGFFAANWGSPTFLRIQRFISPLMSVPHAAVAFGLAFLIAPSGWIMRLCSPWVTGFDRPPDWLIVNDPMGYALLLGLILKEVPFLFLVGLSASSQINVDERLKLARSMGYGRIWGWVITVFPSLYKLMRLPVIAVIAYSTSVVDMAIILGPNFPAMLPVQLLRWMNDPELEMRFIAAAGAVWQLGATLFAVLIWWLCEKIIGYAFRRAAIHGNRLAKRWLDARRSFGAVARFGDNLRVEFCDFVPLVDCRFLALPQCTARSVFVDALDGERRHVDRSNSQRVANRRAVDWHCVGDVSWLFGK